MKHVRPGEGVTMIVLGHSNTGQVGLEARTVASALFFGGEIRRIGGYVTLPASGCVPAQQLAAPCHDTAKKMQQKIPETKVNMQFL